ncbi:MAG: hypothetical protein ACHQVK_02025, partial [Candidatus Paceibacterales bacterium]
LYGPSVKPISREPLPVSEVLSVVHNDSGGDLFDAPPKAQINGLSVHETPLGVALLEGTSLLGIRAWLDKDGVYHFRTGAPIQAVGDGEYILVPKP